MAKLSNSMKNDMIEFILGFDAIQDELNDSMCECASEMVDLAMANDRAGYDKCTNRYWELNVEFRGNKKKYKEFVEGLNPDEFLKHILSKIGIINSEPETNEEEKPNEEENPNEELESACSARDRMKQEFSDLEEKIRKASVEWQSDKLSDKEKKLLEQQLDFMFDYKSILLIRIVEIAHKIKKLGGK